MPGTGLGSRGMAIKEVGAIFALGAYIPLGMGVDKCIKDLTGCHENLKGQK